MFSRFYGCLVLLTVLAAGHTVWSKPCYQRLGATAAGPEPSNGPLLVYLQNLLKQRVLTVNDLQRFLENLRDGQWINPMPPIETAYGPSYPSIDHQIHAEQLDKILQTMHGSAQHLIPDVQNIIDREQRQMVGRDVKRKETADPDLQFFRVNPASFSYQKYQIEVTKPIEVQSTLITRGLWRRVMGVEIEEVMKLRPQTDPDAVPVTSVTFWSYLAFANKLSLAKGLKPYYKLLDDLDGWAEDGTLMPVGSRTIGFRENKEANGYRLPSISERLLLLTNRGRYTDSFFALEKEERSAYISKILKTNSALEWIGFKPEIRQKKPFYIDGYPFFDLVGPVIEVAWEDSELSSSSGYNTWREGNLVLLVPADNKTFQLVQRFPVSAMNEFGARLVRTLE